MITAIRICLGSTFDSSLCDNFEQKTANNTTESKLQQLNKFIVVKEVRVIIQFTMRWIETSIKLSLNIVLGGSS